MGSASGFPRIIDSRRSRRSKTGKRSARDSQRTEMGAVGSTQVKNNVTGLLLLSMAILRASCCEAENAGVPSHAYARWAARTASMTNCC